MSFPRLDGLKRKIGTARRLNKVWLFQVICNVSHVRFFLSLFAVLFLACTFSYFVVRSCLYHCIVF